MTGVTVTGQNEEEETEEKMEEKENWRGMGRADIEGSTRGPRGPKKPHKSTIYHFCNTGMKYHKDLRYYFKPMMW